RRRADQPDRVLDHPWDEKRLALTCVPERHERPSSGEVLRRETGDLLHGGVERGRLAGLRLAVEARRDRSERMLVEWRGDGQRAFPAAVEGIRGGAAPVLARAACELADQAIRGP